MRTINWLFAVMGLTAFAAFLFWRAGLQQPAQVATAAVDPPAAEAADSAGDVAPAGDGVQPAPEMADGPLPEADGQSVTVIEDEAAFGQLLMTLYAGMEQPMRAWAEKRGLPRTDPAGNFMLDQPYQQYDDETLAAMAANGDMWAQQILAGRIAHARPAEAMELYRQAAAGGSVFAMMKLAELSQGIAAMSPDFSFLDDGVALDQYYSLRDAPVPPEVNAYAWQAVAEMAGMPNFVTPGRGGALDNTQTAAACALASSIYSDLLSQRDLRSLGGYPSDSPPVWLDGRLMGRGTQCEHERAVTYDLSGCREYLIRNPREPEEEARLYVCDQGS